MSQPVDFPAKPAEPRHAATVILLREERGAIEMLMTRRHENMSFMGGMWVFPGGTLCPADSSAASLALIPEASQIQCHRCKQLDGSPLPREQCLGLAVAAHRETFEETGVLLASTASGQPASGELLARIHEQRRAIVSQPERFATLLQEEHLHLEIERLSYWAHWITPAVVSKRFDTRFFLAHLPSRQTPAIDNIEATAMIWMTPAAFISAVSEGKMTASQPTLYTLMELAGSVRRHIALDALFAAEAEREVAPVLPKLVASSIKGERRMIVMPWDSEYHDLPSEGVPRQILYPQSLRALPTRVISDR